MDIKKLKYKKENDLNLKVLIYLSRATQAAHRRGGALFKSGGLTLTQFGVLDALYHKGPLTINQIIESILSTGGNITVVVSNLEKQDLVTRTTNPEDKRSCFISITPKGVQKIEELFPKHLEDLEDHFKNLTQEDKEQLVFLLAKVMRG